MSKTSRANRRKQRETNTPQINTFQAPSIEGRTENQTTFLKLLRKSQFVAVTGPAGTGKTYITSAVAAQMYREGQITKIVISRPNEGVGKSLGLLPGDMADKFAPWAQPVVEVLQQHLGTMLFRKAQNAGDIVCLPMEFIRGRTFNDSFVILDEAQNTTPHEMKAFATRIGENTKVVVNGDVAQSDIKGNSGLALILKIIDEDRITDADIFEFEYRDIVRSRLCREFAEAFDDLGV